MTPHFIFISLLLTFILHTSLTSSQTTLFYDENDSSQEDDLTDKEKGEISPLLELANNFESKKEAPKLEKDEQSQSRNSYSKIKVNYTSTPSKIDGYREDYKPPSYKPYKDEPYYKPFKEEIYQKPKPKPPKVGEFGGYYKPINERPNKYDGSYYIPPKDDHKPSGTFYLPPEEDYKPDSYYDFEKEVTVNYRPHKDKPHKGDFFKPLHEEHFYSKPAYDTPFSKPESEYFHKPEEYLYPEHHFKDHSVIKDLHEINDELQPFSSDIKENLDPVPFSTEYKLKTDTKAVKREMSNFVMKKEISNKNVKKPDIDIRASFSDEFEASTENSSNDIRTNFQAGDIDIRTNSPISIQSLVDSVFGSATESIFGNTEIFQDIENTPSPIEVQKNNAPFIGAGCSGYNMDCVPYFYCKNGTLNKKGVGIFDIRFGEDENEVKECPSLEVCCDMSTKSKTPLIILPSKQEEGCGYRNTEGVGMKISGIRNETEFGEFPWMVAIIKETPLLYKSISLYQCGASLIHPKVVLTAAHCVYKKNFTDLRVRAGEWDTQTTAEIISFQDREIEDIIVHKHYSPDEGLVNDIALLFLKSPFEMAENVNPVCLPPMSLKFNYKKCFATGWGKDVFAKEGRYSAILKKIELPVVPNDKCEQILKNTRLGSFFELDDSFMCAGGEPGIDTCTGDGGSPLVCPIEGYINRYFQAGIVAWGIGCNDPIPGVYANVAYQREWIDQQLLSRGLSSSYYSVL